MAHFAHVLAEAIQRELSVDERDARIAAGLLISVHRQLFRGARKQALAGKHGPAAVKRLRGRPRARVRPARARARRARKLQAWCGGPASGLMQV